MTFKLSDKMFQTIDKKGYTKNLYEEENIKEFIRLLKEGLTDFKLSFMIDGEVLSIHEVIDKLSGLEDDYDRTTRPIEDIMEAARKHAKKWDEHVHKTLTDSDEVKGGVK